MPSSAELQREVRRIFAAALPRAVPSPRFHRRVAALLMYPALGPLILGALLFFVFQSVFS